MSLIRELLAPAAEFPNRLRAPSPAAGPSLSSAGRQWVLPLLLLVCFAPRAYLATQLEVLCEDGVYFLQTAEALDRGDLQGAFGNYKINIYPVILTGLHRLGLDWELAGRIWGVGITTLLILPLYGLLRRQFDERIATLSCLLYAVHPNLIEWSPELIRCNTFYFLAVLSLYCAWRAATEASPLWYWATGICVALAAFTRAEGWLFFLPLFCWSASRWRHFPAERRRLAIGLALAIGFLPLVLVLINLTLLGACPQWSPLRQDHVNMIWSMASRLFSGQLGDSSFVSTHKSTNALLWIYVHKLELGVYWLQGLFLLGGIWAWRSVWIRQDQQPLFYVCAIQLLGIAGFLYFVGELNSRYFFIIPILGSPFIALGILSLAHGWRKLLPAPVSEGWGALCMAGVLTTICSVGIVDGCYNNYSVRIRSQRMGQWLAEVYGPALQSKDRTQVATKGCSDSLIQRYSKAGNVAEVSLFQAASEPLPGRAARFLTDFAPTVVVLHRPSMGPFEHDLVRAADGCGFTEVVGERLPAECHAFVVLVSRDLVARESNRAAAAVQDGTRR